MRVFIPNISDQKIGGGWTFLRNFQKAAKLIDDFEIVDSIDHADVLFAFGPTTVHGEQIDQAHARNIPFVLRMDGVPEDNRNSGKGTRRLVEFSRKADYIIYQTNFVRDTVGKMLRSLGADAPNKVIYNGVDTEIFNPDGPKHPLAKNPDVRARILHVNYRKDNNKRFEEVIQMYREFWQFDNKALLVLLGRYPTEWNEHNMGFFAGERFQKIGVVTEDSYKAMVMRSCDVMFYPSYADPAPNVVIEAMACGVPIVYQAYGGVREMVGEAGVAISYHNEYSTMIGACLSEGLREPKVEAALKNIQARHTLPEMIINYRSVFELALQMGGENK